MDDFSKDVGEKFFGRIAGIGINELGNPAAIYAVTARSDKNKNRFARMCYDNGYVKRIRIDPSNNINKLTKYEEKKSNILFYDAIWTTTDLCGMPYCVITNGVHTADIVNGTFAQPEREDTLLQALKFMGYERDELKTPRFGMEFRFEKDRDEVQIYMTLGIVTDRNIGSERLIFAPINLEKNEYRILTTYDGDYENPKPPRFGSIDEVVRKLYLPSNGTAPDLALKFSEKIPEEYMVCTAAVILDLKKKKWNVFGYNLHI
jgi:IMP cyclohydrolase